MYLQNLSANKFAVWNKWSKKFLSKQSTCRLTYVFVHLNFGLIDLKNSAFSKFGTVLWEGLVTDYHTQLDFVPACENSKTANVRRVIVSVRARIRRIMIANCMSGTCTGTKFRILSLKLKYMYSSVHSRTTMSHPIAPKTSCFWPHLPWFGHGW